jgi:amino acid transporter
VLSIGTIATYIFPQPSAWMSKKSFLLPFSILILWLATYINIIGLKKGKWLQNFGGIGTYLPFFILVGVAIYFMTNHPPANSFQAQNWKLNWSDFSSLNLWALIPFAYSGLELSAIMAGEIKDARRNVRLAVIIAAPLIALFYVMGSSALLYVVPNQDIDVIGGIFQAINSGLKNSGSNLLWLGMAAAACATVGRFGALGAWISGNARMAFVVGVDKYLPKSFGKIHPHWHTPHISMIVQAIISTILLAGAIAGEGTTVHTAFLLLLDACIIIYFIPYTYLFACYILNHFRNQSRTTFENLKHILIGLSGIAITLFGIFVALIPPPGSVAWIFELKLIGGCVVLIVAGGCFYWLNQNKNREENSGILPPREK